jgi:hypothetical protein
VAASPFFGYLRPWPSSLENHFLQTYLLDSFHVEVVRVRVLLLCSFYLERARFAVVGEVRVIND